MKRLHAVLLSCASLAAVGLSLPAAAADLPTKAPYAPAYVAPYFSWSGFYAGINGGYGWSNTFADKAKGAVYGGQLGYNWQLGSFVAGLEGDFQGTSIKSSQTLAPGVTGEAKIPAFATVRGRIGYAWDRLLIYGTGGWAYTNTKATLSVGAASVSDSAWTSGYTLGGGLEWAMMDRWSVKGEYLYVKTSDVTLNLAGATATGKYDMNIVRAGLNYRF